MGELPPHVKAYADALLDTAPPLTDEAAAAIRALAPYMPAREMQAA
jgi:hypothetical protein